MQTNDKIIFGDIMRIFIELRQPWANLSEYLLPKNILAKFQNDVKNIPLCIARIS